MRIPTLSETVMLLSLVLGACGGEPEEGAPEGEAAAETTHAADVAATEEDDIGEIVAVVDGIQIGSKEFEAAAARERPEDGEALSDEEKLEILQGIIDEKMLYLEAKKRGIDLDPKVQKVMVNTLLRKDVYATVRNSDFTMAELEAYFEENKDEFVVPEKVQVRRIFVKAGTTRTDAEAKELAESLHRELVASPERFKEIASEKSEDPYRRRGGDLGFLAREGKPGIEQEVVDLAYTLDEGQVSDPFFAGGGYHIVKLEKRRERVDRTFDQMKGSVLRQVKNDRYKELYAAYIAEITPAYAVEIDAAKLAAIEARPARRLSMGRDKLPLPSRGDRPGELPDEGVLDDPELDDPELDDGEVGDDAP